MADKHEAVVTGGSWGDCPLGGSAQTKPNRHIPVIGLEL
jgi:hypothetical protein